MTINDTYYTFLNSIRDIEFNQMYDSVKGSISKINNSINESVDCKIPDYSCNSSVTDYNDNIKDSCRQFNNSICNFIDIIKSHEPNISTLHPAYDTLERSAIYSLNIDWNKYNQLFSHLLYTEIGGTDLVFEFNTNYDKYVCILKKIIAKCNIKLLEGKCKFDNCCNSGNDCLTKSINSLEVCSAELFKTLTAVSKIYDLMNSFIKDFNSLETIKSDESDGDENV